MSQKTILILTRGTEPISNLQKYLLAGNAVKRACFILDIGAEIGPELNKEERILRPFVV